MFRPWSQKGKAEHGHRENRQNRKPTGEATGRPTSLGHSAGWGRTTNYWLQVPGLTSWLLTGTSQVICLLRASVRDPDPGVVFGKHETAQTAEGRGLCSQKSQVQTLTALLTASNADQGPDLFQHLQHGNNHHSYLLGWPGDDINQPAQTILNGCLDGAQFRRGHRLRSAWLLRLRRTTREDSALKEDPRAVGRACHLWLGGAT